MLREFGTFGASAWDLGMEEKTGAGRPRTLSPLRHLPDGATDRLATKTECQSCVGWPRERQSNRRNDSAFTCWRL